jgi:hypothetical protein
VLRAPLTLSKEEVWVVAALGSGSGSGFGSTSVWAFE